MASSALCFPIKPQFFFFFFFLATSSFAQTSFRPKALVLPVVKDASTLQYTTVVNQRTPLVPVNLVVDLGGQFLWVDCQQGYSSSSYRTVRCGSAQCSLSGSRFCGDCNSTPGPICGNNTCDLTPDNTVTGTTTGGILTEDVVSVRSTDGSNPGRSVSVPRFLFSCTRTFFLEGLASGVSGMAGLGRTRIGLPSQFASAFSFQRKFAICLPSSSSANGVVFFGDGPYSFLPNVVYGSDSLQYTPLLINPVSTGSGFFPGVPSAEYFIGVKSIKIDNKVVSLNTTLLSIGSNGVGGTKISTVNPYTKLESSIFKAVTEAFVAGAMARNITRVASVSPFEACFSAETVLGTRIGASVPTISLVLQNQNVQWSIFGANSMVQVNDNVLCLGIVNGGESPRTSIVIGGFQLENIVLQFDLARSRLGFSSTLFARQTTCSNFNFTSNA